MTGECDRLATPEAWKTALEQEQRRYTAGYKYISKWVEVDGELWKKGRWVKQEVEVQC
jgi:hypothetical protein